MVRAFGDGADVNTVADLSMSTVQGGTAGRRALRVTPLMRAAALGHVDVMRQLVERGAYIVKRDSRGWSALCYALGACELQAARFVTE